MRLQLQQHAHGSVDELGQQFGLEHLRAGVHMKALELQTGLRDARQQGGHLLQIDAEHLGTTAHAHARTAQLEIRIDTHGHPGRQSHFGRQASQQLHLAEGLDVQQHPCGQRLPEFPFALAWPCKADTGR